MGRREQVTKAIRARRRRQRDPIISVLPTWACRDGEPRAIWLLDHRAPTEAELVTAIVNAGYTEAVAATAAAKIVAAREKTKPNP